MKDKPWWLDGVRPIARCAAWLVALLLVSTTGWSQDSNGQFLERQFSSAVLPFLKAHCLDCHGTDRQEAKLDLSSYTSAGKVANAHQVWETVLERLTAKEMPPKEAERQPSAKD